MLWQQFEPLLLTISHYHHRRHASIILACLQIVNTF